MLYKFRSVFTARTMVHESRYFNYTRNECNLLLFSGLKPDKSKYFFELCLEFDKNNVEAWGSLGNNSFCTCFRAASALQFYKLQLVYSPFSIFFFRNFSAIFKFFPQKTVFPKRYAIHVEPSIRSCHLSL